MTREQIEEFINSQLLTDGNLEKIQEIIRTLVEGISNELKKVISENINTTIKVAEDSLKGASKRFEEKLKDEIDYLVEELPLNISYEL